MSPLNHRQRNFRFRWRKSGFQFPEVSCVKLPVQSAGIFPNVILGGRFGNREHPVTPCEEVQSDLAGGAAVPLPDFLQQIPFFRTRLREVTASEWRIAHDRYSAARAVLHQIVFDAPGAKMVADLVTSDHGTPAGVPGLLELIYVQVTYSDELVAVLKDRASGTDIVAGLSATVFDYTIVDISPESIVILKNNERRTIEKGMVWQ